QVEPSDCSGVDAVVDRLQQIWTHVVDNLTLSQEKAQRFANRRRCVGPRLRVGDLVWLSSRYVPMKVSSPKFKPRFIGPYKISEVLNPVSFRLDLPASFAIHNVFHRSLLRRYVAPMVPSVDPPAPVLVEGELEYVVEKILDSRVSRRKLQYLVKWKGYGQEDNSWVFASDVHAADLVRAFHLAHPDRPGGSADITAHATLVVGASWAIWHNKCEIVVGSNMDKIYIVMNYVEHDLKSLMETMKQPFLPGEVKTLMIQLLRGVRHLHDNWILHRDLKTSNLLLSHAGILKVGDFGLAREYGSPLKPYTPIVVTLWYRAPELLLGAKEYSTAIDLWSVGCIFGELLTQKPLFQGKSEIDQINKVFKDLGTPSEKIWPGYNELPAIKKMTFSEYPYNNLRKRFGALLSDQGFDLMNKFLTYCPAKRITAEDGLKHEYFGETPLPIDPSMFPTWPAKSEQPRVKRATSPRPPEGGLGYSQLGDDDLKDTGFHLTTTNQGASAAGPGFSLKF
ncbi:unnamed protein product, partial [Ranitomeya imitator]